MWSLSATRGKSPASANGFSDQVLAWPSRSKVQRTTPLRSPSSLGSSPDSRCMKGKTTISLTPKSRWTLLPSSKAFMKWNDMQGGPRNQRI